jgi:hypothetical protein
MTMMALSNKQTEWLNKLVFYSYPVEASPISKKCTSLGEKVEKEHCAIICTMHLFTASRI